MLHLILYFNLFYFFLYFKIAYYKETKYYFDSWQNSIKKDSEVIYKNIDFFFRNWSQ